MTFRIRKRARRDLLKLPDAILIKAFRSILDIRAHPYPRGYQKARGSRDTFRIWIDRNYRILYEVDSNLGRIDIIRISLKDESTYRQG